MKLVHKQNEEIIEAEIYYLPSKFKGRVLEKVTKHMSGFTRGDLDLVRVVKCMPDNEARERLVEENNET